MQARGVTDEDLVRSLLAYLRSVTACPDLAYDEAPTRMSGGYDATILRFSLQSAPDPFSGPLVLRLFQATADCAARAARGCRAERARRTGLSGATRFCRRGAHRAIRRSLLNHGTHARPRDRVGT